MEFTELDAASKSKSIRGPSLGTGLLLLVVFSLSSCQPDPQPSESLREDDFFLEEELLKIEKFSLKKVLF